MNDNILPLVSICIPIYGVEKYIEKCARSVFEQTYTNIEYIFVNDCTIDRSMDILHQVMNDYSHLRGSIRIIEQPKNMGLASARNTAVKNAIGDFIMWVDSDDFVDATIVEKLVLQQQKTSSDIVVADVYKYYKGKKIRVRLKSEKDPMLYIHKLLRDETEHWVWGKLIRRNIYIDNNIEAKAGINMGEDFQVVPQLVYYANHIEYVEDSLYYYRIDNNNSYGHTVSESIQMQRWATLDVLTDFFEQRGYQEDVEYQKLQMVYFQMKTYLTHIGLSYEYFQLLVSKLNSIHNNIYMSYPCYKRLLLNPFRIEGQLMKLGNCKRILLIIYVKLIDVSNEIIKFMKTIN